MRLAPDARVVAHIRRNGSWKTILYGDPHPPGAWETHYCTCELCLEGDLRGEWRLCPLHSGMQDALAAAGAG